MRAFNGLMAGTAQGSSVRGIAASVAGHRQVETATWRISRQLEVIPPRPFIPNLDPLYLFCCAVTWHKEAEPSSGWELVQGLRSWDGEARAVSASLLAKTKDARLRARDLQRFRARFQRFQQGEYIEVRGYDSEEVQKVRTPTTPYGMEIVENCLGCKLRKDKWFCGLSGDALKNFSGATHPTVYPGAALLFVEGQSPRGAFVVCSGKVKLSTTSRDGKVLILKVAGPGEVLGLSAVLTGECYEITAETIGPCQVNFVDRDTLIRLMERHGELAARSALALSREFQSVYRDIHELVLARSSAGKLARLILSWSSAKERQTDGEHRIRSSMTHEEMAQMIGASRETVTRLLTVLKRKEFIRLEGSTLVIRNRTALEAMAA